MKRSSWTRVALVTTLLAAGALAFGTAYWTQATLGPSQVALQALHSDDQVRVTQEPDLIIFEPLTGTSTVGFVLYPGAGVDFRSYSPLLRQIAARNFTAVLLAVPLNLAFFRAEAADQAFARVPSVKQWVVGGHSLGGVVAASYAARRPSLSGIVFWASYPSDDALKETQLAVLSIYGSRDGLTSVEQIDNSRRLLPSSTTFVEIEGGNHAQFGSYGNQRGDQAATIAPQEQWAEIVEATIALLTEIGQ